MQNTEICGTASMTFDLCMQTAHESIPSMDEIKDMAINVFYNMVREYARKHDDEIGHFITDFPSISDVSFNIIVDER